MTRKQISTNILYGRQTKETEQFHYKEEAQVDTTTPRVISTKGEQWKHSSLKCIVQQI